MRTNFLALGFLTSLCAPAVAMGASPSVSCATLEKSASVSAKTCTVQTQPEFSSKVVTTPVHFLALKGTIDETAYAHGKLLAKHFEEGVVPMVLEEVRRSMESLPGPQRLIFQEIHKCVMNGYRSSLTPEFIRMNNRMADGLRAGGVSKYSADDLLHANLAVELSIFVDGLKKQMAENPLQTVAKLVTECSNIVGAAPAVMESVVRALPSSAKFGCSGVAAPASYTSDGSLVLGRNFDSSLVGRFERQPLVIMHMPPNGHRYVGVASVGLHYAAGISGFNDAGLVVSSHELQTEEYQISHPGKKAAIGPYVQNMILARAGTLDEAIEVAKSYKHFGAWTVFIADTKTNEIASIEFTGKSFAVGRRVQNVPRAQTNHFLAPEMKNANFEYSYNKTLESRSRLSYLDVRVRAGEGIINSQWVMDKLASHHDVLAGLRSFGRTVTKAYGTMSHVMIPEKKIFWMTLGDSFPVPSSTYMGFEVDFDFEKNGGEPFRIVGFQKAKSGETARLYNWRRSLGVYVDSYIAFRDRTPSNEGLKRSYDLLTQAVELSNADGILEVPYHYIRARVGLHNAASFAQQKNFAGANSLLDVSINDLDKILVQGSSSSNGVVPYELALAHLWKARAIDLKLATNLVAFGDVPALQASRDEHYSEAKSILESIVSSEARTFYVKRLLKQFAVNSAGEFPRYKFASALSDDIDFITME